MSLHVTSLVAGIFALMMVPLSLQISLRRIQVRSAAIDAKDEILRRRIRAHGNFSEYAPMMLIVLALIEYSGASSTLVWGIGSAFVASRCVHAIGMLYTQRTTLRATAIVLQHIAFIASGTWLVARFFG